MTTSRLPYGQGPVGRLAGPGVVRRRRPGASVLDPSSLAGALHRWRGSMGTWQLPDVTVPAGATQPVGAWVDEIGGLVLSAPDTGARPQLVAVGSTLVVQFDGVDDTLATVADAIGLSETATMWMVAAMPTNRILDRAVTGNNGRNVILRVGNELNTFGVSNVGAPTGVTYFTFAFASEGVGGTRRVYINAVEGASGGDGDLGLADMRLGANNRVDSFGDPRVAEILVCDRALTVPELAELQSYAASVYGTDLGITT